MNPEPSAPLAAIERLIESHAEAVRAGDADALPPLAAQLRQLLAGMVRRPPEPGSEQSIALRRLQRSCLRTQSMLARRQQDAERGLQALASGAADTRDAQAQRVYAPEGTLDAGRWRGRGLGSA